jgi:hypothetical protein
METMDKVQKIDHGNTAPSSKTFRDEPYKIYTTPWGRVFLEKPGSPPAQTMNNIKVFEKVYKV